MNKNDAAYHLKTPMKPEHWFKKCMEVPTKETLKEKLKGARKEVDQVHALRSANGAERKACERRLRPGERAYDSHYQELLLRSQPLKDALFNRVTNVRILEKMLSNLANEKPVDEGIDWIIESRPFRVDISERSAQEGIADALSTIDFDLENRYLRFAKVASYCSKDMGGKGLPLMDAVPLINRDLGLTDDLDAHERWLKRFWVSEGLKDYDFKLSAKCIEVLLKRKERLSSLEKLSGDRGSDLRSTLTTNDDR